MKRNLNRLLIFMLAILLFEQASEWYGNRSIPAEKITAMFEPITSKYGLDIVYKIDENFLSSLVNPGIPAGPSRDSKVTPIRHSVLASYPGILEQALGKYPVDVIKKYLHAIYFAGEIDQDGFKCGGSYDPFRHILYMVDNGYKTKSQAIDVIHHELSSLFLRGNTFLLNPWFDQNPEGFVYLYKLKPDEMLKTYNSSSLTGSANDYEKGFLNTYGQTNFENDFNEYSAMIFTYPEKFKKIMNQYPRVRGKFRVWLEFYKKVDPIFTEEYLLGER